MAVYQTDRHRGLAVLVRSYRDCICCPRARRLDDVGALTGQLMVWLTVRLC